MNFLKRILEVDSSCRDETIIRKAYLDKVKQYHPDTSFRDSKGDPEKFNQVQHAYETIMVIRNLLFFFRKVFFVFLRKHLNQMINHHRLLKMRLK
jgi:curved DNA-binding protein CbpA